MSPSPTFVFEELAGYIHKFTLDIFATDDSTFS
jgi:hypothetical protein